MTEREGRMEQGPLSSLDSIAADCVAIGCRHHPNHTTATREPPVKSEVHCYRPLVYFTDEGRAKPSECANAEYCWPDPHGYFCGECDPGEWAMTEDWFPFSSKRRPPHEHGNQ